MKKVTVTTALGAFAVIAGSTASFADNDDGRGNDGWRYKDLYELKQLYAAFHKAVSHAGIDATTTPRPSGKYLRCGPRTAFSSRRMV